MGIVDRSKAIYASAMKLRQVGRLQIGRLFGTILSTDGRYKAMIDLIERTYFMRAELNAITYILLEKKIISSGDLEKVFDEQYAALVKDIGKNWPEIELRDDSYTIKDIAAFQERMRSERWPA